MVFAVKVVQTVLLDIENVKKTGICKEAGRNL